MARRLAGLHSFLKRFSHCRRGNVAMMFALSLPLLAMTSLVGVDIHRISTVRANLQDALDAAALAAARSPHMDDDNITTVGLAALRANLQAYPQITLREDLTTFHLTEEGAVIADSKVDVETLVANIFLPPYGQLLEDQVQVGVESEVMRSSTNLEVALVLDITGSMAGSKITDLQDAANELIELLVREEQTPYYSKASIVPYSMGVNLGDRAEDARGEIPAAVSISGASRTNPVVITANDHGFETGDKVYIAGVSGMTQLNGRTYRVGNAQQNTFELRTMQNSNVNGWGYGNYRSGGSAWCADTGCRYFTFTNWPGSQETFEVSDCVSERTGQHAYTDAAPSTARVGLNYPPRTGNPCPSSTLRPLTSNKADLRQDIDDLTIGGSTAGHIGLAWGWYTVSPNFNALWPDSAAAAYGEDDLLKVVVLMTDGEFNTVYCDGVISRSSTSGSYTYTSDLINCPADNDDAFSQSEALCDAMKAQDIIIYTVGFALPNSGNVRDVMANCATDPSHVFLPDTGADLREAFRAIARSISDLRIAR